MDAWSDIDLALRLTPDADLDQTSTDWTGWLTAEVKISDHFDIHAWGALYRVFLCDNGLQIDLSLWPWDKFRAVNGEPIKLLFGECLVAEPAQRRPWTEAARMAWLYALHARSAIHRGRALQADLMLTSWRDQIITLAALRHALNPSQGREAHLLPRDIQAAIQRSRPSSLAPTELRRALVSTAELYLGEVHHHDPDYADRLRTALAALAR